MDRPGSALPTKLGQAPSASPRTVEKRRSRLGSLFSSLTLESLSPMIVAPKRQTSVGSEGEASTSIGASAAPTRRRTSKTASSPTGSPVLVEDEGCWIDDQGVERCGAGGRVVEGGMDGRCPLLDMPDEILVQILSRLPPGPDDLLNCSLVCKRLYGLSQSSQVWSRLYHCQPGFGLVPDLTPRIVAAENAPDSGQWRDHSWLPASPHPPSPTTVKRKLAQSESIPVHWPTLYRSRIALRHILQYACRPPRQESLKDHADSVYCVQLVTPWLVTGSRDRSIRIWRLPNLRLDGGVDDMAGAKLVKVLEDAHEGSILSIKLEMNDARTKGVMVTGSSDMIAGVWEIECGGIGDGEEGAEVVVKRKATLSGHTAGVLDVALSKTRIASCSRDTTIRTYDRETFVHLHTIISHTMPINCLAVNKDNSNGREEMASASSDGWWVIWDLLTGQMIRKGGGEGRGLACITWEGDHILTGDNDRSIKVYSPSTARLIRTIEGHTDLVRSIAVDLNDDLVVSGSYDRTVRTWRLSTGEMIKWSRGGHASSVFGVATDRGRIVSVICMKLDNSTYKGLGRFDETTGLDLVEHASVVDLLLQRRKTVQTCPTKTNLCAGNQRTVQRLQLHQQSMMPGKPPRALSSFFVTDHRRTHPNMVMITRGEYRKEFESMSRAGGGPSKQQSFEAFLEARREGHNYVRQSPLSKEEEAEYKQVPRPAEDEQTVVIELEQVIRASLVRTLECMEVEATMDDLISPFLFHCKGFGTPSDVEKIIINAEPTRNSNSEYRAVAGVKRGLAVLRELGYEATGATPQFQDAGGHLWDQMNLWLFAVGLWTGEEELLDTVLMPNHEDEDDEDKEQVSEVWKPSEVISDDVVVPAGAEVDEGMKKAIVALRRAIIEEEKYMFKLARSISTRCGIKKVTFVSPSLRHLEVIGPMLRGFGVKPRLVLFGEYAWNEVRVDWNEPGAWMTFEQREKAGEKLGEKYIVDGVAHVKDWKAMEEYMKGVSKFGL